MKFQNYKEEPKCYRYSRNDKAMNLDWSLEDKNLASVIDLCFCNTPLIEKFRNSINGDLARVQWREQQQSLS